MKSRRSVTRIGEWFLSMTGLVDLVNFSCHAISVSQSLIHNIDTITPVLLLISLIPNTFLSFSFWALTWTMLLGAHFTFAFIETSSGERPEPEPEPSQVVLSCFAFLTIPD